MSWQPMLTALSLARPLHFSLAGSGFWRVNRRDRSRDGLGPPGTGALGWSVGRPNMQIWHRRLVRDWPSQPLRLSGPQPVRFVPAAKLR
jgi:hypothetical protein